MELFFILSTGAAMAALASVLLLPFAEFRAAARAALRLLSAVSEGWSRFSGRLALSDSIGVGGRGRFRRVAPDTPQIRRFLLAACMRSGDRRRDRQAGYTA